MANIKPTRMELLKTRRKLKLANKGYKLLKQKRDALVMEFFNTLKEIKVLRKDIGDNLSYAQKSLLYAQATDGESYIDRMAKSLSSGIEIQFDNKEVMGVKLPIIKDIKMNEELPGYFGHSVELDNALLKYRKLLPTLLKLAEKQLTLKHMGDEIKKTKRRVNSLEYIMIPKLNGNLKIIRLKLEDIERENFSRLKVIKKKTAE